MLCQNDMLRSTTHISSRCSTPDPGSCECYNLPLSYLGGVAGLSLQGSSGVGQYFQVLQVHILGLSRCSTEGEQYAAWPPVCLYLWFVEGISKWVSVEHTRLAAHMGRKR